MTTLPNQPTMPARATVFRWLASNQEFRQLLARQCQAEDLADEILKIADDSSRDYKKKIGADGKVTGSWNGRRKLALGGDLATSHWKILFHTGYLAIAAGAQFAAIQYVSFLFPH
jgi:hypothetical protein